MTSNAEFEAIANAIVEARKTSQCLDAFPGAPPPTLNDAYAVQDLAIAQHPSPIVGWKVAGVLGANAEKYGVDRLVGPVIEGTRWETGPNLSNISIIEGGHAAVEGEIVAILNQDAPADKLDWSADEARALIGSLHAGVEIAGSPYPRADVEPSTVTISNLGNNLGMIVGDELPAWRDWALEDWRCKSYVDDILVGENIPNRATGGPLESVRFLLENAARRGRPLEAGMAICTGAITGVHDVKPGSRARIQFAGADPITFNISG
ncbi:MAG: 2-keto-4-pentenoate hydratase [Pseudomonadota bacterium]